MRHPGNYAHSYTPEEFKAMVQQANNNGFVYYPLHDYDLKKFDDFWWGWQKQSFIAEAMDAKEGVWIISQDPFMTQLVMLFSSSEYRLDQAIVQYQKEYKSQMDWLNNQIKIRNKVKDIIKKSHS